MISGEERVRVYNKCSYEWFLGLLNGQTVRLPVGGFGLMTVNDVLAIDSAAHEPRPFGSKQLVCTDLKGNPVAFEELGLVESDVIKLDKSEILSILKGSAKKIEAWISEINDLGELDFIYTVAKEADLPQSKLKVLMKKMPEKDWLDEIKAEEE